MWSFEDDLFGEEISKDSRKQRLTLLKVEAREGNRGKKMLSRAGIGVATGAVIAGFLLLLYLGMRFTIGKLFTRNDRFKIKNIEVVAPSAHTHDLVLEYLGITEGMNLFGFNMREAHRTILKHAAAFKSLSIRRILPDTVKIEVVERIPLARLGANGIIVVDDEGVVFCAPSLRRSLPLIAGAPELVPGQRVSGMARAAVELLDLCSDPKTSLAVERIAVNRADRLELTIQFGGSRREIAIAWPGMGENTPRSRALLQNKLVRVRQILNSSKGMSLSRLDMTFDDRAYGTQGG
ncbi:MAG: cell division protein FtsQ/DivIB [Kiritimatiellia bacterium]